MCKSPITVRINSLLAMKGISKKDFYRDCEITSASYSQWNTGKTNPTLTNLHRIAAYLDVSVDYLLGNEQKENTPAASSDRDVDRFMDLFTKLTPEQQERELAYLQQLVDAQGK